ncbi:MAG: DNA polymerase I, partial [Clostridia bacterium]|nr:DNA polymerase I [Clostridia bacterium]
MKTLLVIDANSIINRAFYGVAPLTSPSGLPTNAVYGLVNSVASQLEALKPDAFVAAFDLKAPTFRHKIYDAYKAGRRPTPPELLEQFPLARRALAAMGAFVAEKEGYEADDILGTFSREAEERGDTHTYLLTGDRDSLQLVSERTTVLLAGNRETAAIDPAEFFSRYGVTPDRFVDVKALMGDSSDNIPGVPGIGEKTALKLIAAYGDLDTLYASLDTADLPEKQKEKLRAGRESAELSRTLARIERNAPLGFGLAEAEAAERDDAALASLFNELGFARLTERFALKAAKLSDAAPEDARPVTAGELLSLARGASVVFTFTAEGDLSALIGEEAYTLPASELCAAGELFAGGYALVCHDLKGACARLGRPVSGCVFDTMLAAYLDDPGATDYSLSALTAKYPPEKGASPVRYIASLWERLAPRLAESGADKLLTGTEIPVAVLLYEMERDGALVDREGLRDFGGRLTEIASGLEQQI